MPIDVYINTMYRKLLIQVTLNPTKIKNIKFITCLFLLMVVLNKKN